METGVENDFRPGPDQPTPAELDEDLPFAVLRATWQPVALSRHLPRGTVLSYRLLDEDIVVARLDDGLLAARDGCPHKGARFRLGRVCGDVLTCGYHGWSFDRTGRCTNIPSLIDPPPGASEKARLHTFDVQERYGVVWVKLDRRTWAPLPSVPEFEDPAWQFVAAEPMEFRCGFRREVENFLDMTHFAFAHATTLGRAASPRAPRVDVTFVEDGFRAEAAFPAVNAPGEPVTKLQSAHQRHYRHWVPNFTLIRQVFPDGDQRLLLHVPSPNERERCHVFWALAQSPGFAGPPLAEQIPFSTQVLDEDRQMCEGQTPAEVPINPSPGGWGVLVIPGDTLANTFQRTLRRFLLAHRGDVRG
jgi:phenylpropionate dioxygenase-like ring-hydroxylating dioxygenase large terminal subunit